MEYKTLITNSIRPPIMQTIRVNTFQNIQMEYPLGGLGERILARIMDNIIRIAWVFIVLFFFGGLGYFQNNLQNNLQILTNNGLKSILLFLLALLGLTIPVLFYSLIFEAVMNGSTPGKRVMELKVISMDGKPLTFWQCVLRWIFLILDGTGMGLIPMALISKKQRIGDLVAGTVVINTKPNNTIDIFSGIQYPVNYQMVFHQAYQLEEKDFYIIKNLINQNHENISFPTELLAKASTKIKTILNLESSLPDSALLVQIIKDYQFYYQQKLDN